MLIDADPLYADVASALGAPAAGVHTLADLLPLGDEISTDHLAEALWSHPEGLRVLLSPPAEEAAAVRPDDLRAAIRAAAATADIVILHVPRTIDGVTRACMEDADRVIEVLSLDVMSFRAATRALSALEPSGLGDRLGFVVNRAARGEVTAADVSRVFGQEPLACIPLDRSVGRAQDRGRLLPRRGRVGRSFDRLAARVTPAAVTAATADP